MHRPGPALCGGDDDDAVEGDRLRRRHSRHGSQRRGFRGGAGVNGRTLVVANAKGDDHAEGDGREGQTRGDRA
jgi:hypothetical protein